jgi:hypothetical protein
MPTWSHFGELDASMARHFEPLNPDADRRALETTDVVFPPSDRADHNEKKPRWRIRIIQDDVDLRWVAYADHGFEPKSLDVFDERLRPPKSPAGPPIMTGRRLRLDTVSRGRGDADDRLGPAQKLWLTGQLERSVSDRGRRVGSIDAHPGGLAEDAEPLWWLFSIVAWSGRGLSRDKLQSDKDGAAKWRS